MQSIKAIAFLYLGMEHNLLTAVELESEYARLGF